MAQKPHLELEIRNLLLSKYSAREILAQISARLYDSTTSPSDKRTILFLALNSGLVEEVMANVPEIYKQKIALPWAPIIELFSRARVPPAQEIVEAIVKGARKQEQLHDLVLSKNFDRYIPELVTIRKQVEKFREEQKIKQRQNLLDKLAFYRNEQMTEEEQGLLELLSKMYPEDLHILDLKSEFRERWARHIINRRGGQVRTDLEPETSMVTAAELENFKAAFEVAQMIVAKRQDLAYDFAVMFMNMEFDLWALHILSLGMSNVANDWLRADLLIRAQRYIECLDQLSLLEQRYTNDPDTAFGTTYLRAKALWGLKQGGRAIELLQTLIRIRPQYRSAASLLRDWTGGYP